MHIDECPYAVRLTRWVPVSYPHDSGQYKHVNTIRDGPLFREFHSIVSAIVPTATLFEVRKPSYAHTIAYEQWGWHHDTFTSKKFMIVWSNLKPTEFSISCEGEITHFIHSTGERITGIEPYDIILADKMKTEHCGPAIIKDGEQRWLARAFTDNFNIEEYRAKQLSQYHKDGSQKGEWNAAAKSK